MLPSYAERIYRPKQISDHNVRTGLVSSICNFGTRSISSIATESVLKLLANEAASQGQNWLASSALPKKAP